MKNRTKTPVVFRPLVSPNVECCALCGAVAPRGSLCRVGVNTRLARHSRLLSCDDCFVIVAGWLSSKSGNVVASGVSSGLVP